MWVKSDLNNNNNKLTNQKTPNPQFLLIVTLRGGIFI